ncbi:MAG: GntR family transcriptional regulator [Proteobacteria bacterium]|nr:GntR family transcriptional regulator [Pseudomonadota bacterium]MBU1713088.1 GntR family transcriptional regulator [Pseudomonadota bacterium]
MNKLLNQNDLRNQTYQILKEMILRQEIGAGKKIIEDELAKRIGVSRTPLREALFRLENEGIVKIIPRRGAYVAKLSKKKAIEIFQIREVLEGLVARLVVQNMDSKILERLKKCLKRIKSKPDTEQELMKFTNSETEFHALLLSASKNKILINMMKNINYHLQIIRLRTVAVPGRAKKTVEEHSRLLEIIESGDKEASEELMRQHIRSVFEVLVNDLGDIM